ncbi:MAG: hypothetical protein ACLQVF_10470, partial [Isosphaeraceae bacterium]
AKYYANSRAPEPGRSPAQSSSRDRASHLANFIRATGRPAASIQIREAKYQVAAGTELLAAMTSFA